MEPTLYQPHGDLAGFVRYFWTFEWSRNDAGWPLRMFATGVSGILFQHHDGRPALGATAQGQPIANGGCPTSFVYGKRTQPARTFSKGPFSLTGVIFKPQGLSTLLNTRPIDLNDGSVELNEFSRENIGPAMRRARCQAGDSDSVARCSPIRQPRVRLSPAARGSGAASTATRGSSIPRAVSRSLRSRTPRSKACSAGFRSSCEMRFIAGCRHIDTRAQPTGRPSCPSFA